MSNTTSTTPATQHLVTFDRVGRTHNPPPLLVQTNDHDELVRAIHAYADTMLTSRGTETHLEEDGTFVIFAGFHNGGTGSTREVATLCRDEDCPTCGYPETNTVVPSVEGGILPEVLAIHCRRCGGFFLPAEAPAPELGEPYTPPGVPTRAQIQRRVDVGAASPVWDVFVDGDRVVTAERRRDAVAYARTVATSAPSPAAVFPCGPADGGAA